MEEKQVTVGHKSYPLPELYMVIATQNPIEQEGTYNLPEAQLDRFMMHLEVGYPNHQEELLIVELDEKRQQQTKEASLPLTSIRRGPRCPPSGIASVYFRKPKEICRLACLSNAHARKNTTANSPNGLPMGSLQGPPSLLIRCAKALAWLRGDEYVTPTHIHEVAFPVLRHRIFPSFESEADGISRNEIIRKLLDVVAIP